MSTIDVGTEFYHRLANRDKQQGDGKHTAVEFRRRYLTELDNPDAWTQEIKPILLDFKNVEKIGPSFANEAFAYFTKYAKPEKILERIIFLNISKVQLIIIKQELDSGYYAIK